MVLSQGRVSLEQRLGTALQTAILLILSLSLSLLFLKSDVGVLRVVLEVLLFLSPPIVQGFGQTCVEEFQQVQIACTPFESGVLQMAWWF